MANMSYCRFQNTLSDLRDCQEHLMDGTSNLSDQEAKARRKLIEVCSEIALEFSDDKEDDENDENDEDDKG